MPCCCVLCASSSSAEGPNSHDRGACPDTADCSVSCSATQAPLSFIATSLKTRASTQPSPGQDRVQSLCTSRFPVINACRHEAHRRDKPLSQPQKSQKNPKKTGKAHLPPSRSPESTRLPLDSSTGYLSLAASMRVVYLDITSGRS